MRSRKLGYTVFDWGGANPSAIPLTPEAAEFLAMHTAWLGKRVLNIEHDSPFVRPGRVSVVVSHDFRKHIDRIAIREKTDLSNATYLAVMELMFTSETNEQME